MQKEILVRDIHTGDAASLCALLNEIVELGGTTAQREVLTIEDFKNAYLSHEQLISCVVAEADNGELLGFQALKHRSDIPADWGDIATFARVGGTQKGIGSALFSGTLERARDDQLSTINATIRSYNTGGLRFYSKMGFVEYMREDAEPLSDGKSAQKIFKKRSV